MRKTHRRHFVQFYAMLKTFKNKQKPQTACLFGNLWEVLVTGLHVSIPKVLLSFSL